MEPPPLPGFKPTTTTTTSLFQVYLRLRPSIASSTAPSVPTTPSKSQLYPTLPPQATKERFLAVEPVDGGGGDDDSDLLARPVVDDGERTPGAVRHSNGHQAAYLDSRLDSGMPTHITIHPPSRGDSRKRAVEKFAFTTVFEESRSQLEVFQGVGVPGVVEGVLREGRDGLIATLGVTGSGKTHTMLGSRTQRGITQMSLDLLFRSLDTKLVNPGRSPMLIPSLISTDSSEAHIYGAASFLDGIYGDSTIYSRAATPMTDITCVSTPSRRNAGPPRPAATPAAPDISNALVECAPNVEYAIIVSMYEVYNDRIFDLLSYNRGAKEQKRRPLLFKSTEGSPDRKVVAGLRKIVCGSYDEAIMVLETGLAERRVAGTGLNSVSSRSHGFFCVEVKKRPRGGMAGRWSTSNLTIVDLAGSERARNAKTAGATLAEAGKINESLMYLGQCLQMQSDTADGSKPAIVPFRQCKLTELLFSNSFPSHSAPTTHPSQTHPQPQRAVMIVTADAYGDFNATSQILRYSALAREVTVPRMPSVSTLVFQGPIPSSGKSSGRTTPDDTPLIRELEAELARLTDQVDVLALQVAEERVRRREAEAGWRRAEERIETVEQSIRDEVVADMEARATAERRRWMEALSEAADRQDSYLDRKLDLFQRGTGYGSADTVQIFEDGTATPPRAGTPAEAQRNSELEEENRELRARVRRLEQDLHMRSPTRTPATGRPTTPLRGSALRHMIAVEGQSKPPKMSLGLGTSRLGLHTAMEDPFGGLPSSPLISNPSSPVITPTAPSAAEARAAETKEVQRPSPVPTESTLGPEFDAPPLPDPEFDPSLMEDDHDKENMPMPNTMAATQALAALSLKVASSRLEQEDDNESDSVIERELELLEASTARMLQEASAKVARIEAAAATKGSPTRRVTRSSASAANQRASGSPTKALAFDSSMMSPTKQNTRSKTSSSGLASPLKEQKKRDTSASARASRSPKKKSSSNVQSPQRSMHALTPHRGLAGRPVYLADEDNEDSGNWQVEGVSTSLMSSSMRASESANWTVMGESISVGAEDSGNWVVYD